MNHPHINNLAKRPGLSGRVILVHGFNVSDGGQGSTDQFADHYKSEGFQVIEFDTKWRKGLVRDLLTVRFGNGKRAQKLAAMIQPGDILVGHSNGCAIIHQATQQLASIAPDSRAQDLLRTLILIYHNPALDVDAPAASNVRARYIFHTKSDWVVHAASLLLCSNWGRMGQLGYREEDPGKQDHRSHNISYGHLGIHAPGHSEAFKTPTRVAMIFTYHSRFIQRALS